MSRCGGLTRGWFQTKVVWIPMCLYRTGLTVAQTTYAHETVGTCTCRHLTIQRHKCVRSTLSANLTASRACFLGRSTETRAHQLPVLIHDSARPLDRRWDLRHDIRCLFSLKLSCTQHQTFTSSDFCRTTCGEDVHHSSVAARRARLARGRKLFSALLLKVLISGITWRGAQRQR